MPWTIRESSGVAVVEMNSNSVNRQNPAFFADLEDALDRLEAEYPDLPVVLASAAHVFSAGFDFDYWFALVARDEKKDVDRSYARFKWINFRLFTHPRPTVAAINGHAYAGGLITALCCDRRVAVHEGATFTLNEVPIGLAMPSMFTEIIRYAVGTQVAAKAILTGRTYSPQEALAHGIVDELVEPANLLATAIAHARCISPDCLTAYAFSKKALQAPYVRRMRTDAEVLDSEGFAAAWCSSGARSATARTYRELKARGSRSSAGSEPKAGD
jgi:enoyl-CoA hydratase